jgi:hypothetical protein
VQTNKTVVRTVVAVVSDPAKLYWQQCFRLRHIVGVGLEFVHLQDRLLLRFALRYAMLYERAQHVFPCLLLRSVSTRDYLLCMSRIASDAFSIK